MGKVKRSPWLLHYDGSSCNGCDIEVLATMTPVYDAERFGVENTGDPMQADILLITGGINAQNAPVVKQLYDQMPRPKVVVAVGICACTGGVFKDTYNIMGGADKVIPVDIYVPGCAARPQSIIDGILQAVELFQKRSDEHDEYERNKKLGRLSEQEAMTTSANFVKEAAPTATTETKVVAVSDEAADAESKSSRAAEARAIASGAGASTDTEKESAANAQSRKPAEDAQKAAGPADKKEADDGSKKS